MRVALHTTFAASKKEPLVNCVHQTFLDAGLGEPTVRFTFSDAPLPGFVFSVNRVLKRLPDMAPFLATDSPMKGLPGGDPCLESQEHLPSWLGGY